MQGTSKMELRSITDPVIKLSIQEMKCSVTLADPDLYDCPLIGCSRGFETLTGYSRDEVIGRNCRFLNAGVPDFPAETLSALRTSIADGSEFIATLVNRRKDGTLFHNLLHMTTLFVKGKRYIVGVQADTTNVDLDLGQKDHADLLRHVAKRVFNANLDAWIQMQALVFTIQAPTPYSEMFEKHDPTQYKEALNDFISIEGCKLETKNTFLHVDDQEPCGKLKTSASDPILVSYSESETTALNEAETDETEDDSNFSTDCGPQSSNDGLQRDLSSISSDDTNDAGEPKSVGSIGHPDKCTECQFYFFHPSGCRSGADCRYCHAIHPRKNKKKNRRIMKRIAGREAIPEDQEESIPLVTTSELPQWASTVATEPLVNAASPPESGNNQTHMVSLCYARQPGAASNALALPKVVITVGQPVHLPAWVEICEAQKHALQPSLVFAVTPTLPAGLVLDSRSGLISGVPQLEKERQVYSVTVSTRATGPGGIELGLVPLTTGKVSIRVAELRNFQVAWARESDSGTGEADGSRLLVEFVSLQQKGSKH
mmetsp:Transcript_9929/g.21064  ORF Transcript_9929/g.21064 Transcript_9929/m.21064 type:complete len:543 (+) Transcript_9929:129-1757(+)